MSQQLMDQSKAQMHLAGPMSGQICCTSTYVLTFRYCSSVVASF